MDEKTVAQKMDEFCAVLRDGGTLMIHPDLWDEMKREAPGAAAAIEWSAILGGTKVRPNPHVDPQAFYAIPRAKPETIDEEVHAFVRFDPFTGGTR